MQQEPKPQQINVQLDEKVAEGIYSNLALVAHSPAEFFIDFARMVPGTAKASVHARIIMTPAHMKFLLGALKENIKLHGGPPQGPAGGFGFRSDTPSEK